MDIVVAGFQWDDGNWPKCGQHGVSRDEIEALFTSGALAVHPALDQGGEEERFLAIGRGSRRRWLFVVFTLREAGGQTLIRPISVRYMHRKEIQHYEKQKDAQIPPAPEER
jgi:uncharacterized DUF497 family protein